MTYPEVEVLLNRGFGVMLAPRGYTRKDLSWYRHTRSRTVAVFIEIAKGPRNSRVKIRLAQFDRSLCRDTHPEPDHAEACIGMSALAPRYTEWLEARTFSHWNVESDGERFFQIFREAGLPQLAKWDGLEPDVT